MNTLRSALGHYEVVGDPADADCIIGHSFAIDSGETSVNRSLAHFIQRHAEGRPIIADRNLVNAFLRPDRDVAHSVEGPVSNNIGQGVGTWGTLVEAKEFMEKEGLVRPLMVAQAHHIGRVVMQAEKLGIDSIVPAGLPRQFQPDSEQRWTRSLGMWVPREMVGSFVLRAQHRL